MGRGCGICTRRRIRKGEKNDITESKKGFYEERNKHCINGFSSHPPIFVVGPTLNSLFCYRFCYPPQSQTPLPLTQNERHFLLGPPSNHCKRTTPPIELFSK